MLCYYWFYDAFGNNEKYDELTDYLVQISEPELAPSAI